MEIKYLVFQSTRLREARLNNRGYMLAVYLFQSTRLREARRLQLACTGALCLFQSTRLREARHLILSLPQDTSSFNPRACVRRDVKLHVSLSYDYRVSIHAPA